MRKFREITAAVFLLAVCNACGQPSLAGTWRVTDIGATINGETPDITLVLDPSGNMKLVQIWQRQRCNQIETGTWKQDGAKLSLVYKSLQVTSPETGTHVSTSPPGALNYVLHWESSEQLTCKGVDNGSEMHLARLR